MEELRITVHKEQELFTIPPHEDERILRVVTYSQLWPPPAKKELPFVSRPKIPFRSLPELNAWANSQVLKDPFIQLPFEILGGETPPYVELVFVQRWQFDNKHYARTYWLGTVERAAIKSSNLLTIDEITRLRITPPQKEEEEHSVEAAPTPIDDIIDYQSMHKGQPSKFIYIFHRMREDELNRWCQLLSYSIKLNERIMAVFPDENDPHLEEKDAQQDSVLLYLWLYQLANDPDESLFDSFEDTQSDRTRTLLETIGTDLDELFLTARFNRLELRHSELQQHESFVDYFVHVHSTGMRSFYDELRTKIRAPPPLRVNGRVLSTMEEQV